MFMRTDMDIFAFKLIPTLDFTTLTALQQFLSPSERLRNERYHYWQDRQSNLLSLLFAKSYLSQKINVPIQEICFRTNAYGKPSLLTPLDYHFNISHSGNWVVIAFAASPLGIDIEKIDPQDISIFQQFFSESEYKTLTELPAEDQLACFYDLWTLKESYIKAIGVGLSKPLHSFSIQKMPHKILLSGNNQPYFFKQYDIDAAYKFSVCSSKDEFPPCVHIIEATEIIDDILHGCT